MSTGEDDMAAPEPLAAGEHPPTPVETAMLAAPLIDALRLTIAGGVVGHPGTGELLAEAGASPPAAQLFALLRGALGGRALGLDGVRATVRYVDPAQTDASLEELQSRGLVTVAAGELRLTGRGAELQRRLADITCDVVDTLWASVHDETVRLEPLTDRALARVAADDGPAFHVLFPPYDPPRATPASRLAERLACLRFHRADAHAAAWQAAGLGLADVVGRDEPLPPEIEDDTNLRASAPYGALAGAERRDLVRGLRLLPTSAPASPH